MGDMEIPDELIDQLLGEYQGPEQLTAWGSETQFAVGSSVRDRHR
jgi:tRNA uridine 5-carbamoylmethylation protein Kti12